MDLTRKVQTPKIAWLVRMYSGNSSWMLPVKFKTQKAATEFANTLGGRAEYVKNSEPTARWMYAIAVAIKAASPSLLLDKISRIIGSSGSQPNDSTKFTDVVFAPSDSVRGGQIEWRGGAAFALGLTSGVSTLIVSEN